VNVGYRRGLQDQLDKSKTVRQFSTPTGERQNTAMEHRNHPAYPTCHRFQRLANCLTDQHPIIDVSQLSGDGTVAYSGVFNVDVYLPCLSSDGARFLKVGVSGQSGIEEMGAITVRNGLQLRRICPSLSPFLPSHPLSPSPLPPLHFSSSPLRRRPLKYN